MKNSLFLENIKMALQSIRGHLLRTVLTALIIALGIMALVGILTSLDAIKSGLTGQLSMLGANTISIQNRGPHIQIGGRGKKRKKFPKISLPQAQNFKDKFDDHPAVVSVSFMASLDRIRYENKETNPNISVMAIDENYLMTGGYEIESGRNFLSSDVENTTSVALIGQEVVAKLFEGVNPVGKILAGRHRGPHLNDISNRSRS